MKAGETSLSANARTEATERGRVAGERGLAPGGKWADEPRGGEREARVVCGSKPTTPHPSHLLARP